MILDKEKKKKEKKKKNILNLNDPPKYKGSSCGDCKAT